jgi:Ca-activated chloride channel family protein
MAVRLAFSAFALVALLPVVLALVAWLRRGRAVAWPVADWEAVGAAPHTWRERLRLTPSLLRIVSCSALAVAAAGPFSPVRQVERVPVPATMMLVLDASGSMLAMDLAPDRFGAARRFAAGIIARRPIDRIGLLAFGGRTVMLCPVTLDRTALATALRDARAGAAELDEGTALGAALVTAVEQIARAGGERGGVIVILSDGATNDQRLDPMDGAALAERRGIHVHAIGFGRDGPARYPTELGILDVKLPVRDEILRRVTSRTGGRYWRVTDEAALDGVIAALDDVARQTPMRRERIVFASLQQPLVAVAVAVLIVEIGLSRGALRMRRL